MLSYVKIPMLLFAIFLGKTMKIFIKPSCSLLVAKYRNILIRLEYSQFDVLLSEGGVRTRLANPQVASLHFMGGGLRKLKVRLAQVTPIGRLLSQTSILYYSITRDILYCVHQLT
mgnify:CR=1 FL=1